MLTVILIMTTGIIIGYFFRSRKKIIKAINKSTLWIILVLLFFMGVSVGSNHVVMDNLDTIGLRGVQLALATILGSVIMAWLVYQLFFKKEGVGNER